MDSNKNLRKEVVLALEALHKKLDTLKQKVEKLCLTTDCFQAIDGQKDTKVEKKK